MSGRTLGTIVIGSSAVLLGACSAVVPPLPPDVQFPAKEILRYAACELRQGYRELKGKYPNFKVAEYAIAVQLQPKADAQLTGRAGLTGKSTSVPRRYFTSWVLGAAPGGGAGGGPGAGIDVKGHQDGSATYQVKSSRLMNEVSLDCENWSPAYHALTQNLGIREWLHRSANAAGDNLAKMTAVDKLTFTAQIFVKFDAAGAFTYVFPFGTDFATASATFWIDQFLTISMVSDPPKKMIMVRTLPQGQEFGAPSARTPTEAPALISPEARDRLDRLQLEQSLKSLELQVPR